MNIILNQNKYNIVKERKGQLCNILEFECLFILEYPLNFWLWKTNTKL